MPGQSTGCTERLAPLALINSQRALVIPPAGARVLLSHGLTTHSQKMCPLSPPRPIYRTIRPWPLRRHYHCTVCCNVCYRGHIFVQVQWRTVGIIFIYIYVFEMHQHTTAPQCQRITHHGHGAGCVLHIMYTRSWVLPSRSSSRRGARTREQGTHMQNGVRVQPHCSTVNGCNLINTKGGSSR